MRMSRASSGFSMIEIVIASSMAVLVLLGLVSALKMSSRSVVESRVNLQASRMAQTVYTRLTGMNFYDLAPGDGFVSWPNDDYVYADSAAPNFGMPAAAFAAYKSSHVLIGLRNMITDPSNPTRFSRFVIEAKYLRRDSSDINANLSVYDYIPLSMYVDGTLNGRPVYRDSYDKDVLMHDFDGDGRYFGKFTHDFGDGPREYTEAPDTHLKEVTLSLWRGDKRVLKQSQIMSQEKFSDAESLSSEQPLKIQLELPVRWRYLSQTSNANPPLNTAQIQARNLAISKSYPGWYLDDIENLDRSPTSPMYLRVMGDTEPFAKVRIWYIPSGSPVTPSQVGSTPPTLVHVTGADGHFDFLSPQLTDLLLQRADSLSTSNRGEGWTHYIYWQVEKNGATSPMQERRFPLDINPPHIRSFFPNTPVVNTLTPAVFCVLKDTPVVAGDWSSGILSDVVAMFYSVNGGSFQPFDHEYTVDADGSNLPISSKDGELWMKDSIAGAPGPSAPTFLPKKFNRGDVVTIKAEGGDDVMYKTSATWSFTVSIPLVDSTPPEIGTASFDAGSKKLVIPLNDPESGVNPASVSLEPSNKLEVYVDGALFFNNAQNRMGKYYVPVQNSATRIPTGAWELRIPANTLPSGAHNITVLACNHAGTCHGIPVPTAGGGTVLVP